MSNEITTEIKQDRPFGAEYADMVNKLEIKPSEVKMTMVAESNGNVNHHVEFHYEFTGKLQLIGKFMLDIAIDVSNAEGLVTGFNFHQASSLSPKNKVNGDYNPKGLWSSLFLIATVRTKKYVHDRETMWNEVMKDFKERYTQSK